MKDLEPKEMAESMTADAMDEFEFSETEAINVNLYAIQMMITYNPIPTNPTERKKAYHKYWEDVVSFLNLLKS